MLAPRGNRREGYTRPIGSGSAGLGYFNLTQTVIKNSRVGGCMTVGDEWRVAERPAGRPCPLALVGGGEL
jgi:hypothetical protein